MRSGRDVHGTSMAQDREKTPDLLVDMLGNEDVASARATPPPLDSLRGTFWADATGGRSSTPGRKSLLVSS